MDLNTSGRNVTVGSILTPGFVDLQKFMFNDRYHLTVSAVARVCALMTGLMLWIMSSNRYRITLLLLLSNVFLKVRAVYFNVVSFISGAFLCSAFSIRALHTCTSSTINFVGVEGSFLDEVDPCSTVWCNCYLAGCVRAFLQLLKCFYRLLVQLMALPQWGHFVGEESGTLLASVLGFFY